MQYTVCAHANTFMCTHAHMLARMCTCMHTHTHICMHTCTCMYTCAYAYIDRIHTHAQYTCMHAHMYVYTHTHMHACMHTHTHCECDHSKWLILAYSVTLLT